MINRFDIRLWPVPRRVHYRVSYRLFLSTQTRVCYDQNQTRLVSCGVYVIRSEFPTLYTYCHGFQTIGAPRERPSRGEFDIRRIVQ